MRLFAAYVGLLIVSFALEAGMTGEGRDRCARQVEATTPQASQGADGGGLIRQTLDRCGKRPDVDDQTCFALYVQVMGECRDGSGNLDDLSNAPRSWVIRTKLDMNALRSMCRSAHRTKRLPDAAAFEAKICNIKGH